MNTGRKVVGIAVPVNLLHHTYSLGLQICYASIARSSRTYCGYFKNRSDDSIIILDHNPGLPRQPVKDILSACPLVDPGAIVLPNIDYALNKTVYLSTSTLDSIKKEQWERCIGVLQGQDVEELSICYRELNPICGIIGLPASVEKFVSRNELVSILNITKPHIFLEIYSDPIKEVPTSKHSLGIITSLPTKLAFEGRSIAHFHPSPEPINFLSDTQPDIELLKKNIDNFVGLVDMVRSVETYE